MKYLFLTFIARSAASCYFWIGNSDDIHIYLAWLHVLVCANLRVMRIIPVNPECQDIGQTSCYLYLWDHMELGIYQKRAVCYPNWTPAFPLDLHRCRGSFPGLKFLSLISLHTLSFSQCASSPTVPGWRTSSNIYPFPLQFSHPQTHHFHLLAYSSWSSFHMKTQLSYLLDFLKHWWHWWRLWSPALYLYFREHKPDGKVGKTLDATYFRHFATVFAVSKMQSLTI